MKYLMIIAIALVSVSAFAKRTISDFGEGAYKGPAVTLSSAMKSFNAKKAKTNKILVKGEVVKVCQKMGCWLEVKDKTASIRTTMKDYGFTVPKNIKGRTVMIEGFLEQKDLTKATVRHYMKDDGKSKAEIEAEMKKMKGKTKKVFHFVADGVRLTNDV